MVTGFSLGNKDECLGRGLFFAARDPGCVTPGTFTAGWKARPRPLRKLRYDLDCAPLGSE
jgi:hypothetical protein